MFLREFSFAGFDCRLEAGRPCIVFVCVWWRCFPSHIHAFLSIRIRRESCILWQPRKVLRWWGSSGQIYLWKTNYSEYCTSSLPLTLLLCSSSCLTENACEGNISPLYANIVLAEIHEYFAKPVGPNGRMNYIYIMYYYTKEIIYSSIILFCTRSKYGLLVRYTQSMH